MIKKVDQKSIKIRGEVDQRRIKIRGRQSVRSQIKQKKVTMKFLELAQMLRRLTLRRHTKD